MAKSPIGGSGSSEPDPGRRKFLKKSGAAMAAGVTLAALGGAATSAGDLRAGGEQEPESAEAAGRPWNRPNLLFLITDQERYPQHWPEGWAEANLPNRKRLADHGLTFTRHFCNAAMCSPSRATLFTGLYAAQHGVKEVLQYGGPDEDGSGPHRADDPPAGPPEHRQDAPGRGLRRAVPRQVAHEQGPHRHPGRPEPQRPRAVRLPRLDPARGRDRPGRRRVRRRRHGLRRPVRHPGGGLPAAREPRSPPGPSPSSSASPTRTTSWATRAPGTSPATATSPRTRGPTTTARTCPAASSRTSTSQRPRTSRPLGNYKPQAQARSTAMWATGLGTLLPRTRAAELRQLLRLSATSCPTSTSGRCSTRWSPTATCGKKTLVFALSDHGEMGLAHGGMREKAYNAYEETIHVPLVVSNPKLFPGPVKTRALASLIDLMPTVATLAGVQNRGQYDFMGRDLTPIIQGRRRTPATIPPGRCRTPSTSPRTRPSARRSSASPATSAASARRTGRSPSTSTRAATKPSQFELYDLVNDPLELHNMGNPENTAVLRPREAGRDGGEAPPADGRDQRPPAQRAKQRGPREARRSGTTVPERP